MRQYWEAKRQHPDAILLFRMGDFFEVFFDDAREAAPVMGVALTSRPMQGARQPMCGVPHHAWEAYAGKLLRAGKKVVICDQMEQPNGRTVVRREVTRVLTPGTVLEARTWNADQLQLAGGGGLAGRRSGPGRL